MRVDVFCGASRNEGGLMGAVLGLNQAMLDCGVRPRLLSQIDEYTEEDLPQWAPIPVELFSSVGPLFTSLQVRGILKASDAELLHINALWRDSQLVGLNWQKKTGKPVVISPHGMLDPWAVQHSGWKKKLIGRLFADESMRRASCIHALCESEAESIRQYGLKTPVAIIPNGIDLPVPGKIQADGPLKKLLFLGRIHPKKGIDELLKGWAKAKPAGWELLVAGWDDGGHEAGLRNMVEELGVEGSVTFVGSKFGEEKERLLRSVDAFILPSFSEGLPMTVLEAWSYELPVLMTDFCNIPAGFEAEAALRIEPAADSISQGLVTLASMQGDDLMKMGKKGRRLVEERFTWAKVGEQMSTVYQWCLGGDKPACVVEY